ncbi:MAG: hypothetical protein OEY85_13765, partial [Rhodospirillales bacterium]|nr:hypothetical protein [Rhodospirillales bacterium]
MPLADVPNMIPALPEIFLAVITLALLMLGVFQKPDSGKNSKASDFISLLSVIALALTLLLVTTITGGKHISFSGMFVADQFAVFFKCLILIA